MRIRIIEDKENPLFNRGKVKFEINHFGAPTPSRLDDVRNWLLHQKFRRTESLLKKMKTLRGSQVASGVARIYYSRSHLEELEPKYLLEREKVVKQAGEAEVKEKTEKESVKLDRKSGNRINRMVKPRRNR